MTDNERRDLERLDPEEGEYACPLFRCECLGEGCMWWRQYNKQYQHGECAAGIIADNLLCINTQGITTYEQN